MSSRGGRRGVRGAFALVCGLALLAPAIAGPQEAPPGTGVSIQHEAVSCLVAGKHPRLLACFSPLSRLARARVFFRAHGTEDWYYVNMAEDASCFSGVLPKPTMEIEKVDYYVEATSRDFTESLTREFEPIVVESEADCDGLLAQFLDRANVIVGSAAGAAGIPQGFAAGGLGGGVSTGLVVAGIVGGGAVIGGIAVAGGESDTPPADPPVGRPPAAPGPTPTPTPTPEPTPEPTPTPAPTPAPEPTPTPTPPANQPPILKYSIPASAAPGEAVTFDLCGSFDPDGDPLWYTIDFDDPDNPVNYSDAECRTQRRYGNEGTYRPRVCVDDSQNPAECVTVVLAIVESFLSTDVRPAEPVDAPRPTPSVTTPATGPAAATVTLDSQLSVPGATGQIIVNGSESYVVAARPTRLAARGQPGTNRVEALLVDGSGQPGQWRLDLKATRLPVEGLRVLAGQTVSVSPSEAVFALSGRPGDRIVLAFQLPGDP